MLKSALQHQNSSPDGYAPVRNQKTSGELLMVGSDNSVLALCAAAMGLIEILNDRDIDLEPILKVVESSESVVIRYVVPMT
jgi:hypothetical protein